VYENNENRETSREAEIRSFMVVLCLVVERRLEDRNITWKDYDLFAELFMVRDCTESFWRAETAPIFSGAPKLF
jgi:hypothetical protein